MTKIYDLHCHTDQSDGILSPEALVSRAKMQRVDVLAITDHDSIAAISRARQQAKEDDIDLITGVEVSCQWRGRSIHIVGLNFDESDQGLKKALHTQEAKRHQRALKIAEILEKRGFTDTYLGAKQFAGDSAIGRPHFARYLVESGQVKTVQLAFKRYLGAGKPGDIKQSWPDMAEAVSWINEAGGIAVVAHPDKYNLTRTKLCELISEFKSVGGQAIEVISGDQPHASTRRIAELAMDYELLGSCGSDFHAPNNSWQELGKFGKMPDQITPVWSIWA